MSKTDMVFRNNRGLEVEVDGKTYYSFGRNEKGTKTSTVEIFREDYPHYEFIVVSIAIEGMTGKVDFVFGRRRQE
jgi:hypothetical protein